jgi:hypothetical protein
LDAYVTLKAQKDGIPVQEFLNVDYKKYGEQKSFTCLIEKYVKELDSDSIKTKIPEALSLAIKNKENGEILEFLNRKDVLDILEGLKDILTTEDMQEIKKVMNEYNIKLPPNSLKLASNKNKPKQNDAIFRGLDMGILNKIWDEISKMYG